METIIKSNNQEIKAKIAYDPNENKTSPTDTRGRYEYLNQQRAAAVKNSFLSTMNIKAPQERNWAYAYRASKYMYDNINYLYRNEDDPREALSSDVVGSMLHNVFPNIPEDVAKKNAKDIVKTFTGDDMSCTNVLELAKDKVSEGIAGLGVGFQNLAYMFKYGNDSGDPEIVEQRHKDQLAMINAKMSGLKRTDYYNKDFDSFIDKVVLSAADFVPSELASIVPEVLGGTLSLITGNPMLFVAGRTVGGVLAGVMEAGSTSVELARAGADFSTQQDGSIAVGLINGTLEIAGNVAEAKTVESIFNLRRLKKAVGKEQIAKLTARQIEKQIGKTTVKGFAGHLAKEFAGNMVFEPLTEGAQEFVSMYVMNLASEWQNQNTGKSFTEEFTYTPQELADNIWETVKSTARGQLLLGLSGSVVDTISNIAPQYVGGGVGHWKFEAGQLMQAIQTNKLQNHGSNSIFVDSNNVLINDNTKAYKPPVETKNGKEIVGKVDSVKMANINGILTPVNAEEMSKAAYMKKNSKFGMYIDIQEQKESTKEKASKADAEALVGKLEKGKNPIYVSENGEIQVNYQDIDKTILDVMKQLGDDYSGIYQGKGFVTIDSNDKQYTITSSIGEGSKEVTWRTLYDAMKSDIGKKIGIDSATFKEDLKKEFTRLGVSDADKNAEYMSQWVDKYTPVFNELGEKLLGKVNTDEDIDGLKYGTAAMISRFMPIAGYDAEWAKDHIVIDSEIASGTRKKYIKDYGYSYWTDGENEKHYKDISDVPNRDNAVFHISLTDIADQTTGIHEVGHMALSLCADKFISDEYFKKAFAKELEKDNRTGENKDGSYIHRPDEEWRIGDATHEAFAVGLENYINTGVAQNKEMEGLFRKVLNAVKAFWDQFKNKLSPEQQDFYDRMFGVLEDEEDISDSVSEESTEEESYDYYDDTSELERQGEEWWAAHEGERFKREEASQVDSVLDDIRNNPELYKNENGELLAPNGKVSNFNNYDNGEYLYALVRTENFKKWFGDWENAPENASKIVDDNVEPLIVYHHTTDSSFDEFRIGTGNYYVNGLYFMESEDSTSYGEEYVASFLNIRNPYDVGTNKALDSEKKALFIKEYNKHTKPALKVMAEINSNMFDFGLEGMNEWLERVDDFIDRRNTPSDILKSATGFASHIYLTERGKRLIDRWLERVNRVFTETTGIDGFTVPYKGWYIALQPNQIKSTDNNGNFSLDDNRFRYKREYEVNSFNEEMRNGEMVPFYTLDKYRTESEWVDAEKTALRTVSDGSLNWMTFLLRRIIAEVKGEKFSTKDITDDDWNKIAEIFVANAKERIKSENRSRTKKDVEVFEGHDVPKVLIRLLAWDMNTSEQEKINNWVNKFTGRNGRWNDKEIQELSRRMFDRKEFNDRMRYSDGTEASKKYRFLDMVYQTSKKNENFRYTRVGEAYYEGAIREIEANAREIMEIDQTYAPLKNTDGKAVEDVELDFTNVTERDVNKARKEAEQYREQARQAEEEYEKLDNEATLLRANVMAMLDELQETAKSLGIKPEEYNTIVGLAQAIKEKGGKISEDNVKLAETNQNILSKYEARLSELKEEIKVYKKDLASLEIENRRHARDAEKYSKKLSELADKYRGLQLSEKNKENFDKIKTKLENMIDKFNDLRMEDDDIKKKYKAAKRELREAWKLADQYSKKNEKLEKKNDKLLNEKLLDEAVIKQLDINFAEVLNALEDAIKRKERAQRALWNRNNEMRELRERNLISNSRRKWRKLLESKGGDATQDKALAFFAKAFFRSEVDGQFISTKFDSETMNSIANIAQFLQDKGLMKGNTLIKGFSDLKLADYKAMYSAIEADKYNSRFAKEERENKMKADVQFISSESRDEMGAMTLTKKEKQDAKTAWLNGEYDTQEEAEKAFYQKKLDTTHGGTKAVRDAKKKMGYNTRKGLNPNNNFIFNSFTSMFNLMGSMSKKFRDFFYFGNTETNTKGINQVTDDYIIRRQRRRDFVTNELIRILGDKKEVEKFLKETQKNVEIRMVDFNEIPSWLMNQQTFRNYLGIQEESDDSNMLFETEKKEPEVQFDKNYADSTLTLEEVMAIYEHAKQDEDLAHILSRNGNNINPLAVAYIVNQFENPDGKFNKYKEIADTYQKAYELSWDDFKRVANDIYDIALTRYEYYSPARSVDRDTDLMVGYNFDINGIPHEKGKKLTQKERADMQLKLGGDNAIKLSYVTDYNSIADSQEWFIAGAEFFKMWNDIMKNDGGGMRKHIDETFGSRASDTLIKNMRAISGAVFDDIADSMNSFMSRLRNNMAYANLGFSVSSALQQPSVLAFATSEFGAKNMRDAFSTIAEKGGINDFIKYVHENSPQIMAIRDANLSYADRAVEDSKFLKAIGVGQDIAKWGLKGMRVLDQFSRCVTWEAGYRYYLAQGFSDEQAKLRATQACLNINTSTQAKDNPLLYNSKNPLWKGLLMFTNQLNKNWNLLIGEKGFGAIKEKNVAQFIATMCAYGVSTSMILIAKGKFFHNNDDEDKEWWEDLWKDYLSQGITVVPVIGDKISKAINGYSYLDSDIINSGYNFIKRTAQVLEDGSDKNKKKVITATKNFLMDAMELSGSPKLLTKNTYRTLFDDGRFVGDEFFTGWRWTGLLAPSEWFEVITGKEL